MTDGSAIGASEAPERAVDYLTSDDFSSIIQSGGGTSHELAVLQERLEEIILQYNDDVSLPVGELAIAFDEFSKQRPCHRKDIERVQNACAGLLKALKVKGVVTQLRLTARPKSANPQLTLETIIQSVKSLEAATDETLQLETRGRPTDTAADTALIALAYVYIDHFKPGNIWEVSSSERSRFVRFAAEVLSHS